MAKDQSYTWLWVLGGLGAAYLLGRAAMKTESVRSLFSLPSLEQSQRIRALYDAATPQAQQEIDEFYKDIGVSRPF